MLQRIAWKSDGAPHPRPLSHPHPSPGRGAPPPDPEDRSGWICSPPPLPGAGWEMGEGGDQPATSAHRLGKLSQGTGWLRQTTCKPSQSSGCLSQSTGTSRQPTGAFPQLRRSRHDLPGHPLEQPTSCANQPVTCDDLPVECDKQRVNCDDLPVICDEQPVGRRDLPIYRDALSGHSLNCPGGCRNFPGDRPESGGVGCSPPSARRETVAASQPFPGATSSPAEPSSVKAERVVSMACSHLAASSREPRRPALQEKGAR